MKLITTVAAAFVGIAISLSACGTPVEEQSARAEAPAIDHVSAWQEYYDATHPDPGAKPAVDHVSAWQEYYDATHPDPEARPAIDHVSAWQEYYDATHP